MEPSKNLDFNFLAEGQTQKHLTVNEALARLDACAQWVVKGHIEKAISPKDGEIYVDENDNNLLFYLNGGFQTIYVQEGWKAYFQEDKTERRFDGNRWVSEEASTIQRAEFELDLTQSNSVTIPEKSIVFGVSARVQEDLAGANVTSWKIGVSEDLGRYGSGLWLGRNGWSKGLTGTPITYWSDTELIVSGEGNTLQSGKLKLFIYLLQIEIPSELY